MLRKGAGAFLGNLDDELDVRVAIVLVQFTLCKKHCRGNWKLLLEIDSILCFWNPNRMFGQGLRALSTHFKFFSSTLRADDDRLLAFIDRRFGSDVETDAPR